MSCPVCGGSGFVFLLPRGVNAFLLRIEQIERLSQRVPCAACYTDRVAESERLKKSVSVLCTVARRPD